MKVTFSIRSLFVHPQIDQNTNVVGKAAWHVLVETDDGLSSMGAGETVLEAPAQDQPFTPYESLTEDQVIAWVVQQQGGQTFIDTLWEAHQPVLDRMRSEKGLVETNLPFRPRMSADNLTPNSGAATIPSFIF